MGLLQSMLGQPLEDVSVRLRGRVVQVDGMSRVPAIAMRIGNHQLRIHRNRTSLEDSRRKVRLETSSIGVQRLDLGGQVGTVTDTPPGTVDEIVRAGDYEDVTGKVGSGLGRCDGSSERDYDVGFVSGPHRISFTDGTRLTQLSNSNGLSGSLSLGKHFLVVPSVVEEQLSVPLNRPAQQVLVRVVSKPGRVNLASGRVSRSGEEQRHALTVGRKPGEDHSVDSVGMHGGETVRLSRAVRVSDGNDLFGRLD